MIEKLSRFVGTWVGEGRGGYPTVGDFSYREEITFADTGKPFVAYSSRTWSLDEHRPLHAEHGYWRETPIGTIEAVIALSTGHTEIAVGTAEGGRLRLVSTNVDGSPTAKDVHAVRRFYDVDGDVLRYRLEMEAVGQPLQWHLEAELRRRAD